MIKKSIHYIIFLLFTLPFVVSAQQVDSLSTDPNLKRIHIENADVMIGQQMGTKYLQTLVHHVIMRHEGSVLSCDSAILDEVKQSFQAFGHVNITEADGTSLTAEYIFYNGKNSSCKAVGEVILVESSNVLQTKSLDYNLKTKRGYYDQGGMLETEDTKLWSKKGEYNGISHWSHFTGEVIVENADYQVQSKELEYNTESKIVKFLDYSEITKDQSLMITRGGTYNSVSQVAEFDQPSKVYNKDQSITADKLHYDKAIGQALARGHVIIEDTTQHSILYCREAYYFDAEKQALAYGKPVLVKYTPGKSDSTFLLADTLRSVSTVTNIVYRISTDSTSAETTIADTTYKRDFIAWHHVSMYSDSLQSICDSLFLSETDSVIRYYQNPIIWSENRQMKGDTIYTFIKQNNKIDSIKLYSKSSVLSKIKEIPEAMDQILGQVIEAYFSDGEIEKVMVYKNVQCIYYIRNDKKEFVGVHESESQKLQMTFEDDEIDKVKLYEDISGKEHPMETADFKKLKFENSIWYNDLRPMNKSAFYSRIHDIKKPDSSKTEKNTKSKKTKRKKRK